MRYVVVGAGAVGGTVGGRLFEHGHEVVLVARGEHARVLAADGLRLAAPEGEVTLPVPVATGPADVRLRSDDVLVLATKTQHTAAALATWAPIPVEGGGTASERLAVLCAQNGVESERLALRRFRRVYAACVWLPATFLEPGLVVARATPLSGILELGVYPRGLDGIVEEICRHLEASRISAVPRDDVMRWKYGKLLDNVRNAFDALCGPAAGWQDLYDDAVAEARHVFVAAGIDFTTAAEEHQRRHGLTRVEAVGAYPAATSSSWQSLARHAGSIEADFLNGEVVLLGRQAGVPAPVNEAVQRIANQAAAEGREPGSVPVEVLRAAVPADPRV